MDCKGTSVVRFIPQKLLWTYSLWMGVSITLLLWTINQSCRIYYGPNSINKLTFEKYKFVARLLISD